MIRLKPPVCKEEYEVYRSIDYSNYQRKDPRNQPTYFSLETQSDGFDKVIYFRKKFKK
jgi:hypothetical protein